MSQNVTCERIDRYDDQRLPAVVAGLLEAAGCPAGPGCRVLVKPNLVAPRNPALSCSHPAIVRATCLALLGRGAQVTVADSPAFGTGRIVARLAGLEAALADLPVTITSLDGPRRQPLSGGGHIGVSRLALEADHIVNLPRLKCHDQMGLTLAVKNFFGCVCGFRKSLAHQTLGKDSARFAAMILDVYAALPPSTSLLDGIIAMHKAGPVGGEPFALGLLAAAANPVALDTAIYAALGLSPEGIPLWRAARQRGLAGAEAGDLVFPRLLPAEFCFDGFVVKPGLAPLSFEAGRFVRGRIKSLLVTLGRGR
jgi:uncharacterized protein (DUF362 family)